VWVDAGVYGTRPELSALAREAYSAADFRFFRWFAAYPALLKVDSGNPSACVWFHDLRFVTPGRVPTPFIYGMCREGAGEWKPFQLFGEQRRAVY
jgi:inner membrane protein